MSHLLDDALTFVLHSQHLNDCCHEYDEDKRQWVSLPEDQCWCGRTKLIERLREKIAAANTGQLTPPRANYDDPFQFQVEEAL